MGLEENLRIWTASEIFFLEIQVPLIYALIMLCYPRSCMYVLCILYYGLSSFEARRHHRSESKKIAHLLSLFQRLVQKKIERLVQLESTSGRKGWGRKVSVATFDITKRIHGKNSSSLNEEDGEGGKYQRYLCEKHCQKEARTLPLSTTDVTFPFVPNEELPAEEMQETFGALADDTHRSIVSSDEKFSALW